MEDRWGEFDECVELMAQGVSSRSSLKPPLVMRQALREDMDCLNNLRGLGASPGSRSVSSAGKPLRVDAPARYFEAMYSLKKRNSKKCGSRCDGVVALRGSGCELLGSGGKPIWKGKLPASKEIEQNTEFEVQKYVVEVLDEIQEKDFSSGRVFSSAYAQLSCKKPEDEKPSINERPPRKISSSSSFSDENRLELASGDKSKDSAAVVVDPYIASKLRPHQREGVKFMYECVMGLKYPTFTGCLLADEMGLGKTLQVIALIWTLLRQGPTGVPVVKRAAVICPATLVQNWGKEVRKWLGTERLRALVIDSPKEAERKLLEFKTDKFSPLLVASYETLRKHKDVIASSRPELLICDEAHRLKSYKGNKTINALQDLNCDKKILLTGTPVQNNLSEFYALVDFANPALLGQYSEFKTLFAGPIERSTDRNATQSEKDLGVERMEELRQRTSFCVLRRTGSVNMNYLPPKTLYVVFCKLQDFQIILYEMFLKSQFVRKLLISDLPPQHVLSAIGALKKLCNHPHLVHSDLNVLTSAEIMSHPRFQSAKELLDLSSNKVALTDRVKTDWKLSGKFVCLFHLLSSAIKCDDRVVVASNYTQTLDLIQNLCDEFGWKYLRLDGQTPLAERVPLVDRFNRGMGNVPIFLLSSKAGGTGLNLIGANRLILFDPDWNPAVDAQAMGRVWREGQKKPVIIYRLLSTGSIEEKIHQRQIMKSEMTSIVGEEEVKLGQLGKNSCGQRFTRKELRELLALRLETRCETFDILSRSNQVLEEKWGESSTDPALSKAGEAGVVTFVSESTVKS